MNVVKKNRLEEAKLAKAYLAGGMAPYQAARKCGFMRVAVMEEAIRELENAEAPTPLRPMKIAAGICARKRPLNRRRNGAFPSLPHPPLSRWKLGKTNVELSFAMDVTVRRSPRTASTFMAPVRT